MATEVFGNLLIGLAVEIAHEHLPLQVGEDLLHLLLDVDEFLLADDELFRVGYLGP